MEQKNDPFNPEKSHRLLSKEDILDFTLAGFAVLTIRDNVTGKRCTYRVEQPKTKDDKVLFHVKVLTGNDNTSDYEYLGTIFDYTNFFLGRKSRITKDSLSFKVFDWFWKVLKNPNKQIPQQVEIWHEGICGRCGRTLTVPESIERGLGPSCAKSVGKVKTLYLDKFFKV